MYHNRRYGGTFGCSPRNRFVFVAAVTTLLVVSIVYLYSNETASLIGTEDDHAFWRQVHNALPVVGGNRDRDSADEETPDQNGRRSEQKGCLVAEAKDDPDPVTRERRDKVKEMMRHAWGNYVQYAWGYNELAPVSRRPFLNGVFGSDRMGATIVDSMDTLFVMGMMKEFASGREWIEQNLNVTSWTAEVSVFETTIRFVGGLLSCFALTGDEMFREKALQIAERLLPAFRTPTGIPYSLVNLKTGHSKNWPWADGGASLLADIGSLQLEFTYLSDITGNPVFREKVTKVRNLLHAAEKPRGLYPIFIRPETGKWGKNSTSIGALADSFYEYLLKAWIQSNKKDHEARLMFDEALSSMLANALQVSKGGLVYFAGINGKNVGNSMGHLDCFSGGLLALGAHSLQNEMASRYKDTAAALTHTCHESYDRTTVKLGPELFSFGDGLEAEARSESDKLYQLRPEVVESYFVLWRTTHDPKYRDWGWEAVQALEKHARINGGYAGIKNVNKTPVQYQDLQQSFFLAETLKYLYLLFSDDSAFPLNEWVLNTEAHLLPVKGHPCYRELK